MFLDALLQLFNKKDLTAATLTDKSVDLGDVTPKRTIGTGEPVGIGYFVTTAADCTTVKFEVIEADDAALTSNVVVLAEQTRLAADCAAGMAHFMALPPGAPAAGQKRYLGGRVTPVGGNATVSVSAYLMPRDLFAQKAQSYADAVTIS